MNVFKELEQVGDMQQKVKDHQDNLLDIFDKDNEKLVNLLKELVDIEAELEEIDKEYENLLHSKEDWPVQHLTWILILLWTPHIKHQAKFESPKNRK